MLNVIIARFHFQNVDGKSPNVEERRKSASLQALPPQELNKPLTTAERIGGKISRDLANGSSGRGSKSSGLQVRNLYKYSCKFVQVEEIV